MVWVIIPAYNEEAKIGRVISEITRIAKGITRISDASVGETSHGGVSLTNGMKIVVVDDGSNDKTVEIAKSEGALVLRHAINRGQGAALQTGHEYAYHYGAEVVVDFDGDEQFNVDDIEPSINKLRENNLDVVLGSRFLDNRTKMPWLKRHVIHPVGKIINYILTGIKLTDVHNGFRVLSKNALSKIIITQDGMAHNSEIVAQIKKYNLKYAEVPVEVRYYEFGQGLSGGIKIIWDYLFKKLM